MLASVLPPSFLDTYSLSTSYLVCKEFCIVIISIIIIVNFLNLFLFIEFIFHLPPITKTIQVRRTRHAGHCISDVLLRTPTYGRAKAGRTARTYIHQLCEDMGCSPEDQSKAMNDREKWRAGVRDIRAGGTIG